MKLRIALFFSGAATLAGAAILRARAASTLPPYARSAKKRCLLISNSKLAGLEYLDHAMEHISGFIGSSASAGYILFVPYAQRDRDGYVARITQAFAGTGYDVRSLHECETASARLAAVQGAGTIFIGGGNTYRLLKSLQQDAGLLELIASRVAAGSLMYIGSSAGSNLACPTIRNTNDMPIVWPEGLNGLNLVPFQVNTHFIDEERELKNHMGESF